LIAIAIFTWRKQPDRGGIEFTLFLVAVSVWSAGAALDKLFLGLDAKVLIAKIEYIGFLAVAPTCLALALVARGVELRGRPGILALLTIPSLVSFCLVISNESHGLIWQETRVDDSLLHLTRGTAFWFHAAWSGVLLTAALSLLVSKWSQRWSYYRGEALPVLCSFAAPISTSIYYLSHVGSAPTFDFTPAAFSVTAVCFAWTLFWRDGIFDVVRLARAEVLEDRGDGVLVADLRQRLIYANRSASAMLDIQNVSIPCDLRESLHRYPALVKRLSAASEQDLELEIEIGGECRVYDLEVTELPDPQGVLTSRVVVMRDVTERQRAERHIRESENGLRKVIDLVPHIIYAKDRSGRLLFVNRAASRALGLETSEVVGHTMEELGFPPNEVERQRASDLEVIRTGVKRFERESVVTPDGTQMTFQTTRIPFTYPATDTPAVLGISIDMTERLRNEEKIRTLAFYDSLTGLPNRHHFRGLLSRALNTAHRQGESVGLLFLDLDRFKDINDRLGHAAGDRLLCEVARRLRSSVRFTDHLAFAEVTDFETTVSRLAGDEFTVLLSNLGNRTDASIVAQRIIDALSVPIDLDGNEIITGVSVGIAVYPDDSDDADELIRSADQAMYQAKQDGRNCYAFFDPSITASAARRLEIEVRMRHAVEESAFRIEYLPIRNAMTGELCGAEALLRWEDRELGIVSPSEFIPIAEQSGLIHDIGRSVLRMVCEQELTWRQEGLELPRISVNTSVLQISDPTFAPAVARIFEETGTSADKIEFELAEITTLANDENTDNTLRALRDLGIRLVLDDFGSGQSAMRNLPRFGFSRVKIDREFIGNLPGSRNNSILTQGIIGMAHGLGMSVMAVGVETEEQAQFLREQSCDELQGFLFGGPLPPEDFPRFLKRVKPED